MSLEESGRRDATLAETRIELGSQFCTSVLSNFVLPTLPSLSFLLNRDGPSSRQLQIEQGVSSLISSLTSMPPALNRVPAVYTIIRLFFQCVKAAPLWSVASEQQQVRTWSADQQGHPKGPPIGSEEFYWKLALSAGLVLLGGVFAGLTLGLMGLDVRSLHVTVRIHNAHQDIRVTAHQS